MQPTCEVVLLRYDLLIQQAMKVADHVMGEQGARNRNKVVVGRPHHQKVEKQLLAVFMDQWP